MAQHVVMYFILHDNGCPRGRMWLVRQEGKFTLEESLPGRKAYPGGKFTREESLPGRKVYPGGKLTWEESLPRKQQVDSTRNFWSTIRSLLVCISIFKWSLHDQIK